MKEIKKRAQDLTRSEIWHLKSDIRIRLSYKERKVNALALGADEGRG